MAGQAILGDMVLKSAIAMEAAAPTVETLHGRPFPNGFRIAYSILATITMRKMQRRNAFCGYGNTRTVCMNQQRQNVAGTDCLDHCAGQAAGRTARWFHWRCASRARIDGIAF